MENVKLSIIMPVYNTKKRHLKRAIESILNQTFRDFEFLIIDDGCDFKTKKYLKSFKDQRIQLIENRENLGLTLSLNKGLELAKGDYIARADSEDISYPERFEKQLDFMEKNENIGVLICGYTFKKQEFLPSESDKAIKEILKKGILPFDNSSLLIRKSVLQDIKYSESFKYEETLSLLLKLFDKTEFSSLSEALIKKRTLNKKRSKKYISEKTLNNQTIIYLNMEKFFNQACGEEFKIIRKLKDRKRISTKEFKKLFEKKDIIAPNPNLEKFSRKRCLNPFVIFGFIKI